MQLLNDRDRVNLLHGFHDRGNVRPILGQCDHDCGHWCHHRGHVHGCAREGAHGYVYGCVHENVYYHHVDVDGYAYVHAHGYDNEYAHVYVVLPFPNPKPVFTLTYRQCDAASLEKLRISTTDQNS